MESHQKRSCLLEPQKKKLEAEKISQEQEFFTLQKKIEAMPQKRLKIKRDRKQKRRTCTIPKKCHRINQNKRLLEKEKKLAECASSLSILSIKPQVES